VPDPGRAPASAALAPCPRSIDINADLGESYGRWELGVDEQLAPLVTSVSVACGYHAGDAGTMRRACAIARESGVALGAHPGLPDRLGFGRREMAVAAADVFDYCAYQIGALQAIARCEGIRVEHVKPHGALYTMAARRPEILDAIVRCVLAVVPSLILVVLAGEQAGEAERLGARVAREAFIDLDYDDDGRLVLEARKQARSPDGVAQRARLAAEGRIVTVSGAEIPVSADTLCLHGDGPNVLDLARSVGAALRATGVCPRPLRDVLAARAMAELVPASAGILVVANTAAETEG